jgi:hypothetical protein
MAGHRAAAAYMLAVAALFLGVFATIPAGNPDSSPL